MSGFAGCTRMSRCAPRVEAQHRPGAAAVSGLPQAVAVRAVAADAGLAAAHVDDVGVATHRPRSRRWCRRSSLSVIGAQVMPPSVVLKTPPPVVPIQYFRPGDRPPTATERPPRGGPTSRQRNPPKTAESSVIGAVGAGGTARVTRVVGVGMVCDACAASSAGAVRVSRKVRVTAVQRMMIPRVTVLRKYECRVAECRMQNAE